MPGGKVFVPGLLLGDADGAAETVADGTIVRPFLPRSALPRAALAVGQAVRGVA